jgi:hypothetical protein
MIRPSSELTDLIVEATACRLRTSNGVRRHGPQFANAAAIVSSSPGGERLPGSGRGRRDPGFAPPGCAGASAACGDHQRNDCPTVARSSRSEQNRNRPSSPPRWRHRRTGRRSRRGRMPLADLRDELFEEAQSLRADDLTLSVSTSANHALNAVEVLIGEGDQARAHRRASGDTGRTMLDREDPHDSRITGGARGPSRSDRMPPGPCMASAASR